ncbi:hypothetical protein DFH08DRAFT_770928, partial [Mycena albidolilacea]
IRPATVQDPSTLSRICFLTADAVKAAEHLHDFPELPGLVWTDALSFLRPGASS